MSGTREGGLKASQTNKQKYGENFYRNIGADGGMKSRGGGFASTGMGNLAGKIGGMKSANKRYGTPIDQDKLKRLEKELEELKASRNK